MFWGAGGGVLRTLLQFGVQVVMLRMLGPAQYGLFAIGVLVVAFANFLADFGISYSLIQRHTVSPDDVRFVLAWQMVLGTSVFAGLVLSAGKVANFFGAPAAAPVVSWLAVVCLVNALASPSMNLLKRKLDFRKLQLAYLTGYFIGFVLVGLPIAVIFHSVWALVASWLVQSVVTAGVMYAAIRHPVRPLWLYAGGIATLRYGLLVLGTNLVNWIIGNFDRIVVGRIYQTRDIGLYAASYNLVYGPTAILAGVAQPVFFSAASRKEADRPLLARAYLSLVSAATLLVFTFFAGIAAVADTIVLTLYGAAWSAASPLLEPIALAMPFMLVWALTTPIIWAGGKPGRELISQLPIAGLWVAVCLFMATISLPAVAWAVLALSLLRCGVGMYISANMLQLSALQFWRAMRGGLFLSALVYLSLHTLDQSLVAVNVPPLLRLLACFLAGLMAVLLLLRTMPGLKALDLSFLFDRLASQLPPVALPLLRVLLCPQRKNGH